MSEARPGLVVLFGSGETSPSGRRVFDWLFRRLGESPQISILETPAGFEPNSDRVAGQIGEFLTLRLQNHQPAITIIPARKRGTPYSPDEPAIVSPLRSSDVVFLGPGSPTYAVRQLQNSLAWQALRACHRLGAAVVLASAATIALSRHALPVYEIYKVGQDLHWQGGLDFFGAFGLSLIFIPHWNNNDGGEELDTSHCYMGRSRFEQLLAMLPPDSIIVGIDEHTALVADLAAGRCRVLGKGTVTVLRSGGSVTFASGRSFALEQLGAFRLPAPEAGIPYDVWQWVQRTPVAVDEPMHSPPAVVVDLLGRREAARRQQDWATADALREGIVAAGWEVRDTPDGPQLVPRADAQAPNGPHVERG